MPRFCIALSMGRSYSALERITISILQMGKLRYRARKRFIQGHPGAESGIEPRPLSYSPLNYSISPFPSLKVNGTWAPTCLSLFSKWNLGALENFSPPHEQRVKTKSWWWFCTAIVSACSSRPLILWHCIAYLIFKYLVFSKQNTGGALNGKKMESAFFFPIKGKLRAMWS